MASAQIHCITDRSRAGDILHPLRLEILRLAREPVSASGVSPKVGLSRPRGEYDGRPLAPADQLPRAPARPRRVPAEGRTAATPQHDRATLCRLGAGVPPFA